VTTLALLITGALIGLAVAYAGARAVRAVRKVRSTLRRWSRTRLTVTQTPRRRKTSKKGRR
jgi:hypothetical protein